MWHGHLQILRDDSPILKLVAPCCHPFSMRSGVCHMSAEASIRSVTKILMNLSHCDTVPNFHHYVQHGTTTNSHLPGVNYICFDVTAPNGMGIAKHLFIMLINLLFSSSGPSLLSGQSSFQWGKEIILIGTVFLHLLFINNGAQILPPVCPSKCTIKISSKIWHGYFGSLGISSISSICAVRLFVQIFKDFSQTLESGCN